VLDETDELTQEKFVPLGWGCDAKADDVPGARKGSVISADASIIQESTRIIFFIPHPSKQLYMFGIICLINR
jgi:hypothetical protein